MTDSTAKIKNTAKGQSFGYAFDQISKAIENEFFLEALTLSESIISDRLLSYVNGVSNKKYTVHTPFSKLIKDWKALKGEVKWKEIDDLIVAVDEWRKARNVCIHGATKSQPGTPTQPVPEFIELSKKTAKQGKILANYISNWQSSDKRKKTNKKIISKSEK